MGGMGVGDTIQKVASKLNLNGQREVPEKNSSVCSGREENMFRWGSESRQSMLEATLSCSELWRVVGSSRECMESEGREGYRGQM